jgi:hypothetical protein
VNLKVRSFMDRKDNDDFINFDSEFLFSFGNRKSDLEFCPAIDIIGRIV